MKKILMIILLIFVIACSSTHYTMHNDINKIYNLKQIDSICYVEKISPELHDWDSLVMRDHESKQPIVQYFYRVYNDSIEQVYTITKIDTIYKVKKRVTQKFTK